MKNNADYILEEYNVKEDITRLCESYLNEELCIADELKVICNQIINEIKYCIKNNPSIPINHNDVSYKHDIIYKEFLNKNITIEWHYYNFFYKQSYERNRDKVIGDKKSRQNELKVCVVIKAVSGHIVNESFENTVYHEMEHLYQFIKRDCNDFVLKNYNEGVRLMNDNHWFNRVLGEVIYITHTFEQDGKLNGLYGTLMSVDDIDDMWKVFKDSDTYSYLNGLRNNLTVLNKTKENETKLGKDAKLDDFLIKKYNFKLDDLIDNVKKSIKRFQNKIGKVWLKAQNDYKKKHNIREHVQTGRKPFVGDMLMDFAKGYEEIMNEDDLNQIADRLRGFMKPVSYF